MRGAKQQHAAVGESDFCYPTSDDCRMLAIKLIWFRSWPKAVISAALNCLLGSSVCRQ
jgi:hypothetical protein